MVKKLFKHEFASYLKLVLPVYIVLLGIASLVRFIYIFDNPFPAFTVVGVSSVLALVAACIVALVLIFVFVVIRFYKNLFTNEGYLTFTLPVTVSQHIWVKLITGFAYTLATFGVIILSYCVATAGEVTIETIKAGLYLFNEADANTDLNLVVYSIQYISNILLSILSTYLTVYCSIAIGQLSNKARIFVAIAVFIGWYFVGQICTTFIMLFLVIVSPMDWFGDVMEYIYDNQALFAYTMSGLSMAFKVLLSALYYFVTHKIIKNKLNLE